MSFVSFWPGSLVGDLSGVLKDNNLGFDSVPHRQEDIRRLFASSEFCVQLERGEREMFTLYEHHALKI